jgi:hypothetical protein
MLPMNWLGTSESSSDSRYRNSETHQLRSPRSKPFMLRVTKGEGIRRIFRGSDIIIAIFILKGL